MRITVELKDGLVLAPDGRIVGLVEAIDVEILSGPLTPTQIRAVAACPFCEAPRRAMCRRWRGGVRKANHAERIDAARSLVL